MTTKKGSIVVLLADDEPMILDVGKKMLEAIGYTVYTVSDGTDAVEMIRAAEIELHVVLLDITMPVMGGLEAMEKIKTIQSDFPVILSSGYSEDDIFNADKQGQRHPDGFIQKPFQLAELKMVVESVM